MKNLISFLFIGLSVSAASAQTLVNSWEVEGEVDIVTSVGSKPTSERGQVSFLMPSFTLGGQYWIEEKKSVYFQVQMAENRNTDTKKQQLELARAFYQYVSPDSDWIFRYGLIKNAYLEDSELLLDYDLVPEFRSLAYRYNYLPKSDMGMEVRYLHNPYLDFTLGIYNGEENRANEGGAQKDVYLGVNYDDPSFHLSALVIRGDYDEYEKPFNMKERVLVRVVWKGSWLNLGLEGMTAKELSNAMVAYKRADGWDGSAIPEVVVSGQGGSAWVVFKLAEDVELLARKDFLDPYKSAKHDELESENLALIWKEGFRSLILGYAKTSYKDLHSIKSPEKEFGFIGLRQLF